MKELTEEEMAKMFEKNNPIKAKVLKFIAFVITYFFQLSVWFILITGLYVLLRWAIGVWI